MVDTLSTPGATDAENAYYDLCGWLSLTDLPADEYKAMLMLCKRIEMGYKEYGPLYKGKRDWNNETLEEMSDGMVYAAFRTIYQLTSVRRPEHDGASAD